ncbi:hypothetical protein FTUN_0834 [Frigoriglobus tundricola]|uniref:Uncharacterized protein n=1 Tax=Frigoriglobus tundricola TaxID=2774151 RepID=A0A6M5YH78_9BACT|nr:hypothetical protein FTUN_0834 [Frigoriglobus tundricola]
MIEPKAKCREEPDPRSQRHGVSPPVVRVTNHRRAHAAPLA